MLESSNFMRDSSSMSDDPLSDVLKLVDAQSILTGSFTAGGSWAIRFPEPDNIKFFALVKGKCWLCMDGEEEPVRVETGDVLLLSAKRSFVLAGDLAATPVDATGLFTGIEHKSARLGEGEDCVQIGGHVRLDPASGEILADVLPPLIHVRGSLPQSSAVQCLLEQLIHEQVGEQPGAILASVHLTQLMFVHILRAYFATSAPVRAGWLGAVTDRRLAPALRLIHDDPGRSWQLGELAKAAAMSRTTFAVRFKAIVGVAPLTYLTEWRMRLAQRALREGNAPVSELAALLGYGSESAFSNAFKRVTGDAPKRYRTLFAKERKIDIRSS
jgi:AraC-like DNA-binding protein